MATALYPGGYPIPAREGREESAWDWMNMAERTDEFIKTWGPSAGGWLIAGFVGLVAGVYGFGAKESVRDNAITSLTQQFQNYQRDTDQARIDASAERQRQIESVLELKDFIKDNLTTLRSGFAINLNELSGRMVRVEDWRLQIEEGRKAAAEDRRNLNRAVDQLNGNLGLLQRDLKAAQEEIERLRVIQKPGR